MFTLVDDSQELCVGPFFMMRTLSSACWARGLLKMFVIELLPGLRMAGDSESAA